MASQADNDELAYGVEDANRNGRLDGGETDPLVRDTDGDLLWDGTDKGITNETHTGDTCESTGQSGCGSAWIFVPDADNGATVTNPLDRDSDDDGIADGAEDTSHNGQKDTGETDAASMDSDGDGLTDGQEKAVVAIGPDTNTAVFKVDLDPTTSTDPLVPDTDVDGILDGTEDLNRNGRVDSGEANPQLWDTDGDGLPDGWRDFGALGATPCLTFSGSQCLGGWWGEDKNVNGIRDQDSDGNWIETDFLANDSDVEGDELLPSSATLPHERD